MPKNRDHHDDADAQISLADRDWSPAEFCKIKKISKWKYEQLKKSGQGPHEIVYSPRMRRISPTARRVWEQRMLDLANTKAARLERQRRRQHAKEAAAKSAAAREKLSKQNKDTKKKPRPGGQGSSHEI
jgi:hypothetical protein